ncbi:MAG: Butyryl-CoA dehydrogenase [Mycobacterium sp.]|jgi:alkylation response protein AidB-like acyl-CoA dehydrogenase|nr:Butyryl-CoA dehydrogenase [Mycobacterium sp.]
MGPDFQDTHEELRSVASDLLAKERSNPAGVGWPVLARAGWIGLEAPEDFGGAGATFGEVAIILDEMGRAASRSAYVGGAVLAVGTLSALKSNPWRDRLLRGVVSGAVRSAVAVGGGDDAAAVHVPFELEQTTRGLRMHGRSVFVPDAGDAQHLLLPARGPGGAPVIVDVSAQAEGLTITPQPVVDETRRLAALSADGIAVDESWVWQFEGDPEAQVRGLANRAAVAIACDSLGLSEAMLSATVSYAGVRQQFGRPIGSFQAVKHACADMLVQISVARLLVGAAVDAVVDGSPDGTAAASMAKSYACSAAVQVAGKAMQLHGGIGYTWESGIHVYLKRAALNRSLFGSPAAHRKRLAQRYLHK